MAFVKSENHLKFDLAGRISSVRQGTIAYCYVLYYVHSKMSGYVKLLTIIDWKWSR